MSILFLAKMTEWCAEAERMVSAYAPDAVICTGNLGDPLPSECADWSGDHIISFLSPWIVPARLLAKARRAAINFHPGPPEYPGIGCYNFALYDGVDRYGVTCHHMASTVDTGALIAVSRFAVSEADTVSTLRDRSMQALLDLLRKLLPGIVRGDDLPRLDETWTRRPYTRRELDALGKITLEMDEQEIRRRYRAMHFPPYPGLYLELAGIVFRA